MSITTIRENLISAIQSMTIEDGYNYDWDSATVNPAGNDFNRVADSAYPIADFWFGAEECENAEENTMTISNVITVEIDLVPKKIGTVAADVDKCIQDIKMLAGNNYNLSGACFFWWYDSYKRFFDQMHFPEYGVRVTMKIRYIEDRKNP